MTNYATHDNPAWLRKANFILNVDLAEFQMPGRAEQLWTRRIDESHFELCCIPFFSYGFALGDWLEQCAERGAVVVKRMDHKVLRAAAVDSSQQDRLHPILHDWAEKTGLLYEWFSPSYLAIDIPPGGQDRLDVTALDDFENDEEIRYEIDD